MQDVMVNRWRFGDEVAIICLLITMVLLLLLIISIITTLIYYSSNDKQTARWTVSAECPTVNIAGSTISTINTIVELCYHHYFWLFARCGRTRGAPPRRRPGGRWREPCSCMTTLEHNVDLEDCIASKDTTKSSKSSARALLLHGMLLLCITTIQL